MGAEGAVNILYKREIDEAADPAAARAEKVAEFREKFANPYVAASAASSTKSSARARRARKLIAALDESR